MARSGRRPRRESTTHGAAPRDAHPRCVNNTVDFSVWPTNDLYDFSIAHEDVRKLLNQGRLAPDGFWNHVQRIPKAIQFVGGQRRAQGVIPKTAFQIMDAIDLLVTEAVAFWAMQ